MTVISNQVVKLQTAIYTRDGNFKGNICDIVGKERDRFTSEYMQVLLGQHLSQETRIHCSLYETSRQRIIDH